MFRRLIRPFARLLDLVRGLITLVRLRGFADPMPGTLTDWIIRNEGERSRGAPKVGSDDPAEARPATLT
jgi:hypothetical protein